MNPREANLKIINEAVAKVSDTMELKFGCRVKLLKDKSHFANEMWKRFFANIWEYDDGKFRLVCGNGWADINLFQEHPDSWEILGREAQLADVLLAIRSRNNEYSYFVDADGYFHEWFAPKGRLALQSVFQWNLSGGIEHQEDSTIAFIAELLK